MFLLIEFCCGTPHTCLKVMVGGGWWVVVGGLQDLSVSPRPFGFGFETKGLGLRVWGQGLTILFQLFNPFKRCHLCVPYLYIILIINYIRQNIPKVI